MQISNLPPPAPQTQQAPQCPEAGGMVMIVGDTTMALPNSGRVEILTFPALVVKVSE